MTSTNEPLLRSKQNYPYIYYSNHQNGTFLSLLPQTNKNMGYKKRFDDLKTIVTTEHVHTKIVHYKTNTTYDKIKLMRHDEFIHKFKCTEYYRRNNTYALIY